MVDSVPSTSLIRSTDAIEIESMTKIIINIMRDMRIVITYANIEVNSPVVKLPATMSCAPIQEIKIKDAYKDSIMAGLLKITIRMAFMNML